MCRRVREDGWSVAEAAAAAGCSERTTYRWLVRFDADEAMVDRSSAPRRRPSRTAAVVEAEIERLRRRRQTSTQIAATLAMPTSTVCAVLRRLGLNRLWKPADSSRPTAAAAAGPASWCMSMSRSWARFHRPGHRVRGRGPGRKNRGAGWEAVHVAVDDATRLAYVEVLGDERAETTVGFLERAVAWFAERGVAVHQVMSYNGSPYVSRAWAAWMHVHGVDHIRTRPYRPRTNGKAERFIQTLLREWAYAASYPSSDHRRAALPAWIRYYNEQRPHGALGHKTPASRLHDD